ncbi:arsenic resistance protein [Arthrobacter sp. Sa2BUA2]|uniref:Arsenic resistance protein n=1 Tax=Arthrobacter pullicola TaxID=2762224 RepID=A0ABR8YLF9_9MICC|nr:bile acid:sodium symporter [Arthrobacter pullicola]MBD8045048.1 arsenic resistance protein [Arthrobacter pullicola]
MERHQIALYLGALLAGALTGWFAPVAAPVFESTVNPALGALLYATFLGIPFGRLIEAVRERGFMAAVLVLNFLLVPVVVFILTRFIAGEQALLIGASMVLLTPCIDYVIVFSGLAGGASDRLLAAAPVLMVLQMLLLPLYLLVFVGPDIGALLDPGPFIAALVWLILVPLALAAMTQAASRRSDAARRSARFVQDLMVPLMMLTLAVVVGSQISAVGGELPALLAVVPLYAAFLILMVPIGMGMARALKLDVPGTRAVIFSGATRNSLVVLPLALALPAHLALVPLAVVTQTLVELAGMVLLVRLIPRLVPEAPRSACERKQGRRVLP